MLRKLPTEIQELGRTALFRDLSKRELAAVQRLGTVIDRRAGTVMCRIDQSASQVAVVISGELAATTATGRRRHLRGGAYFGSLRNSASADAEPEQVEAVTPVTVFVVGRRELSTLRDLCPRLAARLAGVCDTKPTTERAQIGSWRSHTVPIAT